MSRKRLGTPSYLLHKASGQAVVVLHGKTHYLGQYGTPQSRAECHELIARWLAGGRQLPDLRDEALSVAEVALAYIRYAEQHYARRRQFASNLWRIKL